jgi:hypothetical protein
VTYFGAEGEAGSLNVRHIGYGDQHRPLFKWELRDGERNVLGEGEDVMMLRGRPDALAASHLMCSFLLVAAEVYRIEMRGGWSNNLTLFEEPVREYAYSFEEEITESRDILGALMTARDTGRSVTD